MQELEEILQDQVHTFLKHIFRKFSNASANNNVLL